MTAPCPVVHFEMPYRDAERAARFYAAAFGWHLQDMGAPMGHYLYAVTAAADSAAPGALRGSINGGLFLHDPASPVQHPSVVIAVADLRAAMARIREAGGEVLSEPMAIPGVGDYVAFMDTEGNRHGVLQPMA
jgi:uncharacterized protein